MKWNWIVMSVVLGAVVCLGTAVAACGQDAPSGSQQGGDVMWAPGQGGQDSGAQRGQREGGQREGRRAGVFGKITAMTSDSLDVTGPDGNKVTVKLTSATEFRKERQPVKQSDFKVGDMVMVRTDPANPTTATVVAEAGQGFAMRGGQGGGPGGGGPGGGQGMMALGTLGKDYVVGEVKTVDAPKMTVLRPDNVTQALELNEETSLHRGRDSITMADLQAGDHVFVRGAMANNVFVPKEVRVIPPEMWQRMQQREAGGAATPGTPAAPNAPATPPSPKSPPEPEN
jgi:hypothetical protein